jgi:hypothetical protein
VDISRAGTLIYRAGGALQGRMLSWVDRTGKTEPARLPRRCTVLPPFRLTATVSLSGCWSRDKATSGYSI